MALPMNAVGMSTVTTPRDAAKRGMLLLASTDRDIDMAEASDISNNIIPMAARKIAGSIDNTTVHILILKNFLSPYNILIKCVQTALRMIAAAVSIA